MGYCSGDCSYFKGKNLFSFKRATITRTITRQRCVVFGYILYTNIACRPIWPGDCWVFARCWVRASALDSLLGGLLGSDVACHFRGPVIHAEWYRVLPARSSTSSSVAYVRACVQQVCVGSLVMFEILRFLFPVKSGRPSPVKNILKYFPASREQ